MSDKRMSAIWKYDKDVLKCSNCGSESPTDKTFEALYDYDYDEELEYSGYEVNIEHIRTNYCPNCGAKMKNALKESEKL